MLVSDRDHLDSTLDELWVSGAYTLARARVDYAFDWNRQNDMKNKAFPLGQYHRHCFPTVHH